jgi:CRISPR/Cas system-associated exonuclease Cas4 (RecB family)
MGYPLKQTAVYTLVRYLLDLQRSALVKNGMLFFNHREVLSILKHSLIADMINERDKAISAEIVKKNLLRIPSARFENSGVLSPIFRKPGSLAEVPDYLKEILMLIVRHHPSGTEDLFDTKIRNEFIYRVILAINRLEGLASEKDINLTLNTWTSLLDRLLKSQSVPFSGEPLSGIQIMGILETRILDFRNLIILSVNEGVLPAITSGSSFIPFSLREAFRLPSINHRESVYAYHFYRLLQRAENVTFVFNSNPEGLKSGEMSRFLQQMKYDPGMKPGYLNLGFDIRTHASLDNVIERTEEHQEKLISRFSGGAGGRYLSPSAINMWLNCRMKFYYRYVCGLREPEGITEEIDPALLGTILHEVMNRVYSGYRGKNVTAGEIERILSDRQSIMKQTACTISEVFNREDDPEMAGNELIVNEVLMVYIRRILETDRAHAPFTVIDLESPVMFTVESGRDTLITAGGKIDRVDRKGSVTRIMDYKTGTIADSISSLGDLFQDDRKKDADGWLQTLLYCEGWLSQHPGEVVAPSVYRVKKISDRENGDMLRICPSGNEETTLEDYTTVRSEFVNGFRELIRIIFSPDEPFRMTAESWTKCRYCPYRRLCLK